MGGRVTTLRNMKGLSLLNGELPAFYPIFHVLCAGEAEGLCAEVHNSHHRNGERRPLCASYSSIILKVEPRALLARTATPVYM